LWLLPLVLALTLVLGVLGWLRQAELQERDDQRQALITDALSLRAQFEGRIETERQRLMDIARNLDAAPVPPSELASVPGVLPGLRRFWISITWLDPDNRMLAQLPEQRVLPESLRRPDAPSNGLSAHLTAPLAEGGTLIARYSPQDLLRQSVPWWLTRKYDVRLVDNEGNVLASTLEGPVPTNREAHRASMTPALADTYLELIARDVIRPWYRTLPVALISAFAVLVALATGMLRKQMLAVSRAEEAWRTEAAWRSAMEDSLTVGLRARDLEGALVYVNRALGDMIGWQPEELIGLKPPMPYWPPDSLEDILQRHQRNLAGHAPREGYEARWQHRDGHLIDVMIFEAPLVDARGRHIGWMGSIVDITERKRHEERERRQNEAMAHHSRLTMLGEVASALAHELNQPLSAIASYNAGVLNWAERQPQIDSAILRALKRIGEQAAHAGSIVQRIREFLTRREPRLERCDLNTVTRGALLWLRRELERHQVELELRLDPRLHPVVADQVLMEQVIVNLVRNAVDALGDREGPRRIEVASSLSADGRFARIDVSDNGPGLHGLRIDALCAPFYSTKAEGMGMGLAICRSIIEAHRGVFDAQDMPGGGARFSLTIPVNLQHEEIPVEEETQ
jgi:two-component system sensor histidine kinase DctS